MALEPTITVYVTLDLLAWQQQGTLVLSPKFQRRSVWSDSAKSSFIDTVLRGFPIPPLHLRMVKDSRRGVIREVVDGQQRLRALLGFIEGEFRLSGKLDAPWAGKAFKQLAPADREQIENYRFQIYQYSNISDEVVLEIFSRINTYSVSLNAQELRYGKYFGEFKNSVYQLSLELLDFWTSNRVFTNQGIARMQEAQFVSEALVMQLDGPQDKKSSLSEYYKNLDDSWGSQPRRWGKMQADPRLWLSRVESEQRFRACIKAISTLPDFELKRSEFRRVPLFYTLYSVIYHRLFGLPGVEAPTPTQPLDEESASRLVQTLEDLSDLVKVKPDTQGLTQWQQQFVIASSRQTDNLGPRQRRFDLIWRRAGLG